MTIDWSLFGQRGTFDLPEMERIGMLARLQLATGKHCGDLTLELEHDLSGGVMLRNGLEAGSFRVGGGAPHRGEATR